MPDAFQSGMPANYRALAVEKLRKYVRLLGNSLSKKNSDVLPESAKAYRTFAEQKYCERESLISMERTESGAGGYRSPAIAVPRPRITQFHRDTPMQNGSFSASMCNYRNIPITLRTPSMSEIDSMTMSAP